MTRVVSEGIGTEEFMVFLQEVAAEVITPRFQRLTQADVSEKHPGDLVTVADREAETLITARLNDLYPKAVVLGEEAYHANPELLTAFSAAEHSFTVDPVDGTKNFVHGSPDHAVMVSELRGGDVVRAWIWQPEHQQAWMAERGAGVTRNGERMHRSPVAADAEPRVVTTIRRLVGTTVPGLAPIALTWVCSGVDYPKLVEGATDVIVYHSGTPWDHAPGSLLVTEAGGALGYTDATPFVPNHARNGIIVAADQDTLARVTPRLAALNP